MKLKKGDKVRIREFREEWCGESLHFVTPMKNYCGEEFTIQKMTDFGYIRYKNWSWHEDWLELVEEESEVDDVDPAAFEAMIYSFMKG